MIHLTHYYSSFSSSPSSPHYKMPKMTPTRTLMARASRQGKVAVRVYSKQNAYRNAGITKRNVVVDIATPYVPRK